jgi:hypothetical protein
MAPGLHPVGGGGEGSIFSFSLALWISAWSSEKK